MSKSKLGSNLHKPKTLAETLEGLLMLQNWQTQLLELAVLQARSAEVLATEARLPAAIAEACPDAEPAKGKPKGKAPRE